jgi:DNA-directed RNA polymerase subunit RPC12/RpoP
MNEPRQRKTWPPKDEGRGVVCPRCACADLRVLNTRNAHGRIIRYRQCRHCGHRLTTYEVIPSDLDLTQPVEERL